jgi:hypothetical protein
MFESFKNVWMSLRGMNFYLEVTVAAFVAYFWLRHIMEIDVKKAVWVPFLVSLVGQFAYGLQYASNNKQAFGLDDVIMALFMSLLQGGLASMVYTMAEKNGWIDKLGSMVGKKMEGPNG